MKAKSVVGVDGCKDGWLAIRHSESGALDPRIVTSLSDLAPLPDVIAIDIPIGLRNTGARTCDRLARKFIGPRASSVFPAPIRPVLEIDDFSRANKLARSIHGKGMSKQTVAIMPKIRKIDKELQSRSTLRNLTYEVHPEVTFRAWLGKDVEFAKKGKDGFDLRSRLVEEFFGRTAFQYVRESAPKSVVADDDILDAFAAVWSAWRILAGISLTLPEPHEIDTLGLRMGIWY